ncbi:MAG: hypothetical protein KJN94_08225, partial [Gammaproteobacteria bacterium]|nr:hypothetical protein [Gammaproteobacteria bacterium]
PQSHSKPIIRVNPGTGVPVELRRCFGAANGPFKEFVTVIRQGDEPLNLPPNIICLLFRVFIFVL